MRVWQCPGYNCGHLVSDVQYTSIIIDACCPICGKYYLSEFRSLRVQQVYSQIISRLDQLENRIKELDNDSN